MIMNPIDAIGRRINRIWNFLHAYSQHLPLALSYILALPCVVTTLQGKLRGRDERFTVLYAGRRKNDTYLLNLMFESYVEVEKVNSTLLSFKPHLQRMASAADVVIVDIGWPYHGLVNRRGEYLEIPDWIRMTIELPTVWEDVVRNFRQTTRNNDLRLIRRNGYQPGFTAERAAIEAFYDTMYLPFVTHKHASGSIVASRRQVLRQAMKGQLLQVLRGDEVVVAGVICASGDVLYFLWMGIAPAYLDSPPEGAISALYLFGIRYAFDHHCTTVDFTGTRAFLGDGAFRFKRKWGALVEDTFSPSSILMRPQPGSRNGAQFCEQFPILARRSGRLEALFVSVDKPVDDAAVARLKKEYGCNGLEYINVIGISDKNATRSLPLDVDGCQSRLIDTSLDRFTDHYVARPSNTTPATDAGMSHGIAVSGPE